ncbi:MAG: leucine-rich repeat protein [Bacteroidales bacterium]|nr:leucine-rich repeat protein [Bacteroidales bacterium]
MKKTVKVALLVCLILLVSVFMFTACNNNDTPEKTTPEETTPDYYLYQLNADGETYSIIGLQNCTNTALVVPSTYKQKQVTSIADSAFKNCSFLESITIPDSVTSIGEDAFLRCHYLKSITLPDSITSIGNFAFASCTSLTNIVIPKNVTSIGERTFWGCTNLKSITIPNGVTSIGEDAFLGCTELVEVYNLSPYIAVKKGSTTYGWIGAHALGVYDSIEVESKVWTDANGYTFYEDGDTCYLIEYTDSETTLILPASCNGKNYAIHYGAFFMTGLTSITIPNSVTQIGDETFAYCYLLTSITFEGTVEQWNAVGKDSYWNIQTGNYTIYCTNGTIAKDGTVTYY